MTDFRRHSPDRTRPQPEEDAGAAPFDGWEELLAELEGWAAPRPVHNPADGLGVAGLLTAWSTVDADVAAAGGEIDVELALDANSNRRSVLLTAVGRLVDADPADTGGSGLYLDAFRRPMARLSFYLAGRTVTDPVAWYDAVQHALLAANHELVLYGGLFSGSAVVERARSLLLRRGAGRATGPVRAAVAGLAARCAEAVEAAVHHLLGPDVVERLLQRLAPLDLLVELEAMVEDGIALDEACCALGLRRRPARRQLATYRAHRRIYEAEVSRIRPAGALRERE